jgi:hypothetical protein
VSHVLIELLDRDHRRQRVDLITGLRQGFFQRRMEGLTTHQIDRFFVRGRGGKPPVSIEFRIVNMHRQIVWPTRINWTGRQVSIDRFERQLEEAA